MLSVQAHGLLDLEAADQLKGLLLPFRLLAAVLRQLARPQPKPQAAEAAARVDRRKLPVVTDQDHLGVGPLSVVEQAGQLAGADHAGTLVEPSKLTLGAFLDEWVPAMAGNLEPNTHEVYCHYARAYLKPKLGHVRLQQLTATDLRGFYTELAASGGRRSQGLKPKTVKNVHALIHRALEDAVDQGLVTRNVAALRSARPPKLEKTERGVWTPEDLRVFLTGMAADRLAALWLLLATTGLRRSEALGLSWRTLDLERGQLTITQRLLMVAGTPTIRRGTKSPAGQRSIALDPAKVAALKAHRARQLQERLAGGEGWQDHGLAFTREDGTPLRPTQLTRMFGRLARGQLAELDAARTPAHLRYGEPASWHPRESRE